MPEFKQIIILIGSGLMSVVANHMISNPLALAGWGIYTKRNMLTEVDHIRPQVCEVLSSEASMQ